MAGEIPRDMPAQHESDSGLRSGLSYAVGRAGARPIEDPQSILRQERSLPLDLEELDQRLEAAFISISGFHTNEPCVWACACFLVDGSQP